MNLRANKRECEAASLDPNEVDRIARALSRWGKKAEQMGLKVFGSGNGGALRYDTGEGMPLVVADLDGGCWDGGGGESPWSPDGLRRGEEP